MTQKLSEYEKKHIEKGDAQTARDVEMLGIGYTPPEIVNFMVESIAEILRDEFNTELGSDRVEVSDQFTGTGRFLVGLVNSDQLSDEDLKRKYDEGEINGQEILPESHAEAKRNIEQAYKKRTGESVEFRHLKLGDTFQDAESWYESKA